MKPGCRKDISFPETPGLADVRLRAAANPAIGLIEYFPHSVKSARNGVRHGGRPSKLYSGVVHGAIVGYRSICCTSQLILIAPEPGVAKGEVRASLKSEGLVAQ